MNNKIGFQFFKAHSMDLRTRKWIQIGFSLDEAGENGYATKYINVCLHEVNLSLLSECCVYFLQSIFSTHLILSPI